MHINRWKQLSAILALTVVALLWSRFSPAPDGATTTAAPPVQHPAANDAPSVPVIRKAPRLNQTRPKATTTPASTAERSLSSFDDVVVAKQSNIWMTTTVRVKKQLPDDTQGDQHQRFLVVGRDNHSILIAHNIDIAPKVPLQPGDIIEVRGRYEWNDKGGVLHWTHRDPSGRKQGGWIRHKSRTYK